MCANSNFLNKLLDKDSFDFKTIYDYVNKNENNSNSKFEFLLASYLYLNDSKKGFDKIVEGNKSKFHELLIKLGICNYKILDSANIRFDNDLDEYLLNEILKYSNSRVLSDFFYQIIKNKKTPEYFKNVFTKIAYRLMSGCDITNFIDSVFNMYRGIVNDINDYNDIVDKFNSISGFVVKGLDSRYKNEEKIVLNLINSIRLAISDIVSKKGYSGDKIDSDDKKNEINKVVEKFINIYRYIYAGGDVVPEIGSLDIAANSTDNVTENNAIISGVICNFVKVINDAYLESDFEGKSKGILRAFDRLYNVIKVFNNTGEECDYHCELMSVIFSYKYKDTIRLEASTGDFVSSFYDELYRLFESVPVEKDKCEEPFVSVLKETFSKYSNLLNYDERIRTLDYAYNLHIYRQQSINNKKILDKNETEVTKKSDELMSKGEVKEPTQNGEIQDLVTDEKTEELFSTDEAITDDKLVKKESKDSDEKIDLSQESKGISFKSLSTVEFKLETEPEVIQPLLIDEKVVDKTIELQEHNNVLLPSSYHDGSNKENLVIEKIMPERTSEIEQFRRKIKYFEELSKDSKEIPFTRSVIRRRTEKSIKTKGSRYF